MRNCTALARTRATGSEPVALWRGQHRLAAMFEGVAEAVAAGGNGVVACAVVGRQMASEGADLGEALEGLRLTMAHVTGGEPPYEAIRALGTAWAEEALGYVQRLSCVDPLTGLARPAHLRSRLAEIYRGAGQRRQAASATHALVMVAMVPASGHPLDGALEVARLAERVRQVFVGEETLCRAGAAGIAVLARRTPQLERDTAGLRQLVAGLGSAVEPARVWVEGLPPTLDAAGLLLDEFARTS